MIACSTGMVEQYRLDLHRRVCFTTQELRNTSRSNPMITLKSTVLNRTHNGTNVGKISIIDNNFGLPQHYEIALISLNINTIPDLRPRGQTSGKAIPSRYIKLKICTIRFGDSQQPQPCKYTTIFYLLMSINNLQCQPLQ
jgi:hypothetical protein